MNECHLLQGIAAQVLPTPADFEKSLRSHKIPYYSKCELLGYQQRKLGAESFRGKGRRKGSKAQAASSSDDDAVKQNAPSMFLQIQ